MILKAPNTLRLIEGKAKTYLSAVQASGSGTLTVESVLNFAISQWILIGPLGEERSEVIKIHAATTPTGSTITLASNTAQRHEVGTPVQVIDYDQVEFSRATTETGSKSTLATNSLSADQMDSVYEDTTNTTGFGFYRFKNSASTTYSAYSDAIPYAGYNENTVRTIIDRALSVTNQIVSPRLTYDTLFNFVNDFIVYANSKNSRWSDCKVLNYSLDIAATGDFEWTMPTNIAKNFDPSSIISVQLRGYLPMTYVPQRDFEYMSRDARITTNTSIINDSDVTIVLTSSYDFADSGSIEINGDVISYTGNTRLTGTLTGVTGIQTGGHAASSYVLQGHTTGEPIAYTIPSAGKVRVWPVCSAIVNNRQVYINYFKAIPRVDSVADNIVLSNIQPAIDYVAYRIKKYISGGTLAITDEDFQQFITALNEDVASDMPGQFVKVSTK